MTATLYSYSDASAPQLSSTVAGSLRDILKAVLIDGYGTRTPKGGWTMPFDDAVNNKFVLKNPAHTGYLWIDDNIHYGWAHAYMYRTMTDINTGIDQVPNATSMVTLPNHYFPKRYNTVAASGEWHILVDDAGEWFYYWARDDNYPPGFFFGNIIPTNSATTHSKLVITGTDDTSSLSSNDFRYGLFDSTTNWYIQDDRYKFGDRGGEEIKSSYDTTSYLNPNPLDGKLYFQNIYLTAVVSPFLHYGQFPSMYRGLGASNTIYQYHQKITLGADKFIVVDWNSSTYLFKYDTDTL